MALLAAGLLGAAPNASEPAMTVQVLDLTGSYLFVGGGDAFRLASGVEVLDDQNRPAAKVPARSFVRVWVNDAGFVTKIVMVRGKVAASVPAEIERFAVFRVPSPAAQARTTLAPVSVTFVVRVPPTTAQADLVYITVNELGWNPTAIRMNRIDASHYATTVAVADPRSFRYLYTRGSVQSLERAGNGVQRSARRLAGEIANGSVRHDAVAHWGDEAGSGQLPYPQAQPTPYNPGPYPNLPLGSGRAI